MESKEFSRHLVKEFDVEQDDKGSITINGIDPLPETINYSDEESVKIIASKAFRTADGFYELIKKNYNTSELDISSNARLEMYLALSGLACEIYMKGIIYFENKHGNAKYMGHKLSELFNNLPEVHKKHLRNAINDIDNTLPTIENVFMALRYDYELSIIEGNYLVLFDLMEELKTISSTYPKIKVGEMRFANGTLSIE